MFKLQPNPTFKAKVQITIAGQSKPGELTVEFKHMSRERVLEYFETVTGKSDAEALAEIIVGWADADQPYSDEALAVLLDNYPQAAAAIFTTFRNELFEARTKN